MQVSSKVLQPAKAPKSLLLDLLASKSVEMEKVESMQSKNVFKHSERMPISNNRSPPRQKYT